MNERDAKFFRPLWIRVLVTIVLAVWCGLEVFLSHDQLWIGITGIGVLYCLYNFFWKFPKEAPAAIAASDALAAAEPPPQVPPDSRQP